MLKSLNNSRKSSPSRTPAKKQQKMQSLLDPSRLRPPPLSPIPGTNENARMNLSLGVQLQHDDENEIMSISQMHGEPSIV